MFFGAGNTIFPLLLGVETGKNYFFAFLGLLLTGVGGPLLGLLAATSFQGCGVAFFQTAGKKTGLALMTVSLALLGPFAVLPRCVEVARAAFEPVFPFLHPWAFNTTFCLFALFCAVRRKAVLPALGYVLSPFLLGCLFLIIVQGFFAPHSPSLGMPPLPSFKLGFVTGYDTMDLIASLFFSAGIWSMVSDRYQGHPRNIFRATLTGGIVGMILLAVIYLGLAFVASKYANELQAVPHERIMSRLALLTLGPSWGLVASLAVVLACLTTVISLMMTISTTIKGPSYVLLNVAIAAITLAMLGLGFDTIMHLIHTMVSFCYPIIILLVIVNLARKKILLAN